MEMMEGEMMNLIKVLFIVFASLKYCYFITSRVPKGLKRLLFFLPINAIFLLVPLLVSSALLQSGTAIFIAWLANFKLISIALGHHDPLSTPPSISFLQFFMLTSFPIEIMKKSSPNDNPKTQNTPKVFIINMVLWSVAVQMYMMKKHYRFLANPIVHQFIFTARMQISVYLNYTMFRSLSQLVLKQELKQQFDNLYLSTSLQNYWGERWNLPTSSLLKSTIYIPTRSLLTPIIGRNWALYPAILTTFFVSGLMHELVYLHVGHKWPTWEITWFFIINGICVALEIYIKKKASKRGWFLRPMISRTLTMGFLIVTYTSLCYVQVIHFGADAREIEEYSSLVNKVKSTFSFRLRLSLLNLYQ